MHCLCCCCLCKETINASLKWHKSGRADVSRSHNCLSYSSVVLFAPGWDPQHSDEVDKVNSAALRWSGPAQSSLGSELWQGEVRGTSGQDPPQDSQLWRSNQVPWTLNPSKARWAASRRLWRHQKPALLLLAIAPSGSHKELWACKHCRLKPCVPLAPFLLASRWAGTQWG